MLLPTLFGHVEPLPDELQDVITISLAQGGLGIPLLREEAVGLALNKQEFRDSLRMCYNLPLLDLPSGSAFSVSHACVVA